MSPRSKIRTLVVDDEEPARRALTADLGAFEEVEVVGECANGFEAVKAVTETRPDLLFLDIQMPRLDGFEVLDLLAPDPPAVIFVTAFDHYAVEAFESHAVDYLLKPVDPKRLATAIERVGPRLAAASTAAASAAAREMERGGYLERVLVRDGPQIHILSTANLEYVEAQDDHLLLVGDGKRLRKAQTLTSLAARLDPGTFVQIHRSYLLNTAFLTRIELYAKDSRVAILRDGTRLSVSRSGYGRLRELL
jgi:two-component system LytT family response regulator